MCLCLQWMKIRYRWADSKEKKALHSSGRLTPLIVRNKKKRRGSPWVSDLVLDCENWDEANVALLWKAAKLLLKELRALAIRSWLQAVPFSS
mmetsp:Transcript_104722/g.182016  ORF Transcript_104722/g.182016 Transcript_104722/m.182016 type:complete len:92 (+) Transcript_104722:932-1207(+)